MRLRLADVATVGRLEIDLGERRVVVFHEGDVGPIEQALATLGLGSRLIASAAAGRAEPSATTDSPSEAGQRRLLWTVLAINFTFFVIEVVTGLVAGSMGLVADSLDMLADALVYGLALLAVGASLARKRAVARGSGYLQLLLAVIGFAEVVRRFLGAEAPPDFRTMIVVSALALAANGLSLYLLHRARSDEVHMRASMIFTSNDVIINLGVILAGVLVGLLGSGLPDLIIGTLVFALVTRGAIRILRLG